jgi:hypothetical protein
VASIYITQCAENIIIHNIIQMCTLFDLYIINVQKNLQTNNEALLQMARQWIHEKMILPQNESLRIERTVIYVKGATGEVKMELRQEKTLLNVLRRMMSKYGEEKLVILEGDSIETTMPFKDLVELFQSASVVIGAQGIALANMLLVTPLFSAEEAGVFSDGVQSLSRTKVLEFATSPQTKNIQYGSFNQSYFSLLATAP